MLEYYDFSVASNADICIFSELVIPGYILGDIWERQSFLDECVDCGNEAISATKNNDTVMVFGNVGLDIGKNGEDGRPLKFNATFVAQNGVLVRNSRENPYDFLPKTLMPNYREFDDSRHFSDCRKIAFNNNVNLTNIIKPFVIKNGVRIGVGNCEDFWDKDYMVKPIDILNQHESDLFINISCSPYTSGKKQRRNIVFGEYANKYKKPLVYVNNVGCQNNGKTIYTFDGGSCVYDSNGFSKDLFEPFEDGCKLFDLDTDKQFTELSLNHSNPSDIEMLYKCLRYGIKEFMNQIGVKKVVIGASGGIDSAVVAALFSSVMPDPNEDLYLINMPTKFNSAKTKDLAYMLSNNIGCKYYVIPIEESVNSTREQLQKFGFEVSNFCFENIQARDRSARVLSAIASSVGGVFTCNANKSEMTVGYTTLYGDLGGFFAPLADVWKTDVYKLANYINVKNHNLIPSGSITVKPSAELSEKHDVTKGFGDPLIYEYHDLLFKSWVERWDRATPADILQWLSDKRLEENLGCEFDIVVKYFNGEIALFIEDLEKWWNLFDGFAFAKRIQAPPVLATSRRVYGFDLRESQTAPFYSKRYYALKNELLISEEKKTRVEEILTLLSEEQLNILTEHLKRNSLQEN